MYFLWTYLRSFVNSHHIYQPGGRSQMHTLTERCANDLNSIGLQDDNEGEHAPHKGESEVTEGIRLSRVAGAEQCEYDCCGLYGGHIVRTVQP